MKLLTHKQFKKDYRKLSPKIQSKVDKSILLFLQDPTSPILRNHRLQGTYIGFRSLDVMGDLRIIFRDIGDNQYEIVELVRVGSHSQLY